MSRSGSGTYDPSDCFSLHPLCISHKTMKLSSCIQRSCKTCSCGVSVFIRVFHTVLILGIPATLLIKKSALRTALIEFQDPVYGFGYLLLVLTSLAAYYTACFIDPGYIHVEHSKRRKKLNANKNQEINGSESDNSVEEFSIQVHKKSQELEEDHVPMLQCDEQVMDWEKLYRYCDYCETGQPMRARHCEDCKLCVRRYDHHCPWLEACVGERNHKYFWCFLCSTAILIVWTVVITWSSFEYRSIWTEWFEENVLRFIDMLVLVIGGFSVIGLFGFHSYLMFKGQTTWETVSRERITYLKYLDEDVNPFDEGCFMNMYNFLTTFKTRRWEVLYEKNVNIRKSRNTEV